MIPVGDLHTEPTLSPFTSGFFPSEITIKVYLGLSRALMAAIHTAISLSGESPACLSHAMAQNVTMGSHSKGLMPCYSSERCLMMSYGGQWGGDVE